MTEAQTVTEAQTETPQEHKAMTWRVLRRDTGTIPQVTRWEELEPLTGAGPFGFYPTVTLIGETYGEGDYILIRNADGGNFATAQKMKIVADKVYRLADD